MTSEVILNTMEKFRLHNTSIHIYFLIKIGSSMNANKNFVKIPYGHKVGRKDLFVRCRITYVLNNRGLIG